MKHNWFVMFIKENIERLLEFCGFMMLLAVLHELYNIPVQVTLYMLELSCFFGAIILGVRLVGYYNEYKIRVRMLDAIVVEYKQLPKPHNLAELHYQNMIVNIANQLEGCFADMQRQTKDQMDYYTTWIHQIKTPIAAMQMMLQEEDTETNRELQAELFRIEQYVEMVLCYIRLESKSKDYVFESCNLSEVVTQAVRKYAAQFIRKKIKLQFEPKQVMAVTDEKWLSFIVEQILSNAIKYTITGTIRIDISENKVIMVQDTGIGIAKEDLPRIFEKGFTGFNGRADKKATGIGLYLCKQAADKLGITLSVESEPSVGSIFRIDCSTYKVNVE